MTRWRRYRSQTHWHRNHFNCTATYLRKKELWSWNTIFARHYKIFVCAAGLCRINQNLQEWAELAAFTQFIVYNARTNWRFRYDHLVAALMHCSKHARFGILVARTANRTNRCSYIWAAILLLEVWGSKADSALTHILVLAKAVPFRFDWWWWAAAWQTNPILRLHPLA